jgi:iron complex outermembrane receptor protein
LRRAALLLLACLLAITAVGLPGVAWADARTEARTHFKKGMGHVAAGRYEEGISELKQAYELLPHPNVLYNIARAAAESGDLEQAIVYYKKYLEGAPPDKDEVGQIVANLEARQKRQQAAAAAAREAPTPAPAPTPVPTPTATATATATPTATAPPPPPPPPKPPPKEELGGQVRTEDVFAETVVTASKASQSPLDAPSSTSVITEQDIRLSGITKVPELLRRLAGVDIMETTGAQTEVSLRGFNQRLSNKILVLVNGRSVFVDLLGATFWQGLSIGVEDIERIEVVRGAGSALYGADAFNGVVNVITKKPGEGRGGFSAGYGTQSVTHGSVWAAGRDAELAWRASAGYDYLPRFSREVPPGRSDLVLGTNDQDTSGRTMRLDLRTQRRVYKDWSFNVGGGFVQGNLELLGIGPLNDIVLPNVTTSDLTASITSDHFEARVFWNRFRSNSSLNAAQIGQSTLPARAEQNVVDAEAQYFSRFETGKDVEHDLHVGVGYRYKGVDWTYLDRFRQENHYSGFASDAIKLGRYFGVVASYRADYVPYLDRVAHSPRGALLFHPTKQSTVRASVGTAFRTPTFLEAYLAVPIQLPFAGGALVSEGLRSDDPSFRLKAEQNLATEVGYLNQESDYFVFDSALFYNRVSNLIQLANNRPVTVGDLSRGLGALDPQTGLFPLFFGGFSNQCQAYDVFGGEVGVRTFPVEGLDVYANYTLNLVRQDNSGCSPQEVALLQKDERTSVQKINAGAQVRTKIGFDASADFHIVSQQIWAEQVANVQLQRIEYQPFKLSGYTLLNARLGWRLFENRADVAVVGFNLLGIEHREHPFGQLVARRVMGLFTYRF